MIKILGCSAQTSQERGDVSQQVKEPGAPGVLMRGISGNFQHFGQLLLQMIFITAISIPPFLL